MLIVEELKMLRERYYGLNAELHREHSKTFEPTTATRAAVYGLVADELDRLIGEIETSEGD